MMAPTGDAETKLNAGAQLQTFPCAMISKPILHCVSEKRPTFDLL